MFADMLQQTLTYWSPGSNDGFGGVDFAAVTPRAIDCRWQAGSTKYRDAQGVVHVGDAVVYVGEELALGGYVLLSDAGSAAGVDPIGSGALEIRFLGLSPALHLETTLFKYIVGKGS